MTTGESPLLRWVNDWQTQGVSTVPETFRLHHVDCVPSTTSYLWKQVSHASNNQASHSEESIVAIARRQSRGRGQWGRQWISPPGGLYLSASLPTLSVSQSGPLMLSCAWGIASALRQFGVPVQLKWPNDLVVGARKLGGMLIETRLSGPKITQVGIGVGINWRNDVPPGGIALAELRELDIDPQIQGSISTLTATVLTGIAVGYGRLQFQGIEPILTDYETLMTHRGQTIAIENQGVQTTGRVMGVAPTGQLRLGIDSATHNASLPPVTDNPTAGPLSEIIADPGSIHLTYDTINSGC